MIADLIRAPMLSPENENPALGSKPGFRGQPDAAHSTPRPKKWQRILRAFLDGRTLNRFDAERLGDHVLHSTVAKLQGKGLIVHRRDEAVPGYMGCVTHVCRYWLSPQSRARGAELLGGAP